MASDYIKTKINGQDVGLKFGLYAIQQIHERIVKGNFYETIVDAKPGEPKEGYSVIGLAHIVYAGYCNNQMMNDDPIVLTFEDCYEFTEDCLFYQAMADDLMMPIINALNSSRYIVQETLPDGTLTRKYKLI